METSDGENMPIWGGVDGKLNGIDWLSIGKVGYALNLTGAHQNLKFLVDNSRCANNLALCKDGISWTAWVKILHETRWANIVRAHSRGNQEFGYGMAMQGNPTRIVCQLVYTTGENWKIVWKVSHDEWNHIACTWSDHIKTLSIYINGHLGGVNVVPQPSYHPNITFKPFSYRISIGSGVDNPLYGLIDEFGVWETPLQVETINALAFGYKMF